MTVSYFYFHSVCKHSLFAIFDMAILQNFFVFFREYFYSLLSFIAVSAVFSLGRKEGRKRKTL